MKFTRKLYGMKLSALILAGSLLLAGCTQTIDIEPKGSSSQTQSSTTRGPDQTTVPLPAHGYEAPLSDQMKQELSDFWRAAEGKPLLWGRDDTRYYGTYGDCIVLRCRESDAGLDVITTLTVAGYDFDLISSDYDLLVYHKGQFIGLKNAYESGLLTKEQIAEIAEYHANY